MQRSGLDGGEASRDASGSLSQSHPDAAGQGQHESCQSTASSSAKLLPAATSNMAHSVGGSPAAPSKSHTPNLEDAPQSHPMTASNSNSSHQSSKEAAAAQAAHYGTRSRNRPSRPNYAEDVEMDFEQAAHVNGNQAAVTAPSPPTPPSGLSPGASAPPKHVASASNAWPSVNSNSSIPGTSTFSANPNATASKKRKAAHGSSGSQGNLVQTAQAQAVSRRANTLAGARETRETNMYSFDNTKAKLNSGKLIADDGTEFCVNGKFHSPTCVGLDDYSRGAQRRGASFRNLN